MSTFGGNSTPVSDFVVRHVESGDSFVTSTNLVTISGTSETAIFLFRNPSASGKRVILLHSNKGTDSSSARSIFRYYCAPTVTADGTGLSENSTYMKSSPVSSVCNSFKSPTISSNGTFMDIFIDPAESQSNGINRVYWMDENQEFLVTVENSVSNAKSFFGLYWLEVDV